MSLGLQLILSTTLVTAPPGCSWAHPGANPYRGDPVQVLDDFGLPEAARATLRAAMRAHRPTDVVTITRDDIVGRSGTGYGDLREMHSGHGQVCHGDVDRTAWNPKRREHGLVYCAGDACVIVPTICNNVSLVTRKPDHEAVLDDSPIDIAPAAGPPSVPPGAAPPGSPGDGPLGFIPTPGDGSGGGGGSPGDGTPVAGGGGPSGGGGGGVPIMGSNPPCCDTGPIGPVGPGRPPITPPTPTPVPEAPTALLLLAGLVALWPWVSRRPSPRLSPADNSRRAPGRSNGPANDTRTRN